MRFHDDFAWGVATSAYQIEGASRADGKGESIWDRFAATPGRISDGTTGDVACDHYHRWEEDVRLMADLGVDAYRFSVAWTRVFPDGGGAVNEAGLDFYDRLVDGLLEAGIRPHATLYHWDLPQALEDQGGWRTRDTVAAFERYADAVSSRLGDRVTNWMTHNEPWVAAFVGHLEGVHAPGLTSWDAALTALHHILLSHGRAVPILRSNSPNASVGIALDCRPAYPASSSDEDTAAAHHFDGFRNRWIFDPVFGKGYPADMIAGYSERGRMPAAGPTFVEDGDYETMGTPIDFVGINYYTSLPISAGRDETEETDVPPGPHPPDGYTEMGWPITPDALPPFLQRVHRDYAPSSIIITENGASFSDGPGPDGRIDDTRRIEYLASHTAAVGAAIEAGVPVDGYFLWSLLDNFEWSLGYQQRFGIVHVDRETLERTPKASYDWYKALIAG